MSKNRFLFILFIASLQWACDPIIFKPKRAMDPLPIGSKLVHSEKEAGGASGELEQTAEPVFPWNLEMIGVSNKSRQADPSLSGNANIKIAVLSTGVDYNHKALYGAVPVNDKEFSVNGAEVKVDRKDSDNNGFVDDVVGWDVVDSDGFAYDRHGAGTAVAGILAARPSSEMRGILDTASTDLFPIRYIDNHGKSDIFQLAAALQVARRVNPDIVYIQNISLPADTSPEYAVAQEKVLTKAVRSFAGTKTILVVGAGDDMGVFPSQDRAVYQNNRAFVEKLFASQPQVVVVSSVDNQGKLYPLSNKSAKSIHLSAPGVGIRTTRSGGGYTTVTGTAYAAAHVAAVLAIAKAKFGDKASSTTLVNALADPAAGTASESLRSALASKSGTILNAVTYLQKVEKDIQ